MHHLHEKPSYAALALTEEILDRCDVGLTSRRSPATASPQPRQAEWFLDGGAHTDNSAAAGKM